MEITRRDVTPCLCMTPVPSVTPCLFIRIRMSPDKKSDEGVSPHPMYQNSGDDQRNTGNDDSGVQDGHFVHSSIQVMLLAIWEDTAMDEPDRTARWHCA